MNLSNNNNLEKKMPETISKDRIRLLITIEDNEFSKLVDDSNFSIPGQRFVFGLDLNLRRTIEDILADLRSKLIKNNDNEKYGLELYLRNSTEYFIPPWSSTRDVLQNDDQVFLRFRPIFQDDDEKEKKSRKREERKRKRKLENEIANGGSELNSSPKEDGDFSKSNEKGNEESISAKKKKNRRSKSKSKSNLFADEEANSGNRKAIDLAISNQESKISDVVDRSPKKKRRKEKSNLYDNAMVIRNGETGKIQHVYFDSPASSPISEESTAAIPTPIPEESKSPTKEIPSKIKKQNKAINGESKNVSSKVLQTAKISINDQTTCDRLNKIMNADNSSTDIQNSVDDCGKSISSNGVAVEVTKKSQNQGKKKGKIDHYANVSILMKQLIDAPATSTPIGNDNSNSADEPDKEPISAVPLTTEAFLKKRLLSDFVESGIVETNGHSKSAIENDAGASANGGEAEAAATIWKPTRKIAEYPLIKHAASLRIGDRLAYRVMQLNELDCTPGVSDWKIGVLTAFDVEELKLWIELISGEARCEVPRKFRLGSIEIFATYDEDVMIDDQSKVRFDRRGDYDLRGQYNRRGYYTGRSNDADLVVPKQNEKQEDVLLWSEILVARLLNE